MMGVIALIALAVIILIGFRKKVNIGFFSIGAAFVIGSLSGMSVKEITAGFSSSMFVTLLGVTFLFGIVSQNGTLELLSRKIIAAVGKRTFLIPILMFVLAAVLSSIGPGHVPTGILMTTLAVCLAFEMKIDPLTMALFAKLGANAGSVSRLTMAGTVVRELSLRSGYPDPVAHVFFTTLLSGFLYMLILYIGSGSYRISAKNPIQGKDLPPFQKKQVLTLGILAVTIVCCIVFSLDTGLMAFVAAGILIGTGLGDEKKAIEAIPFGTLILICGVSVLVHVIDGLGGITMISDFIGRFLQEKTVAPILSLTSGMLSWVSSTTGVVLPTMFPIAGKLCEQFPAISFSELASVITASSFAAAISPLSTGGAIILSSYGSVRPMNSEELNQMFWKLFLLSAGNIGMNVILSSLGIFRL